MPTEIVIESSHLWAIHQGLHVSMRFLFAISFLCYVAAIVKLYWSNNWYPWLQLVSRGSFLGGMCSLSGLVGLAFLMSYQKELVWLSSTLAVVIAVACIDDKSTSGVLPRCLAAGLLCGSSFFAGPFLQMLIQDHWQPKRFSSVFALATWHIVLGVVSELLCVLALLCSLAYLWAFKLLKARKVLQLSHFPSLEALDNSSKKFILIGWVLMTSALITGFSLSPTGQIAHFLTQFKVYWAFAIWLWFCFLLIGREVWGWHGRKGARYALWGAIVLLFPLFGSIWSGVGHQ